ncbi:MAG: N-acetyltransferase, partial [Bacteroidota bacterium]
ERHGQLAGYILLTHIRIRDSADREYPTLALAPVAVHPNMQGEGIGSELIQFAHRRALELGHSSVVLIGHEHYYPRFGYQRADRYGITFPFDIPVENGFAVELIPDSLANVSGEVVYPKAFFG